MFLTVIVFLIILTILVLIHEAGHFFVAKFFGIKVEEFGIGFPPRAFSKKIGETVYSVNWLPIGGFVKLYGEDEAGGGKISGKSHFAKASRDKAFFAKPWWQKALVVFAGVFMNFVLAVVIISFLFSVVGVQIPDKVLVTGVSKNSPAEKAGLKTGDLIISIDNVVINSSQTLVDITRQKAGEKIELKIKDKTSKIKNIELIPRKNYPKGEGPMGVAISQSFKVEKTPWYKAPIEGFKEAWFNSKMIVVGLGTVVYQLVTLGQVPKDVAGPIGIAEITGEFVKVGPFAVLSLVSLLSLNLAVLNILPIPALDGGRLFFILIEGITRRKVSPRIEGYIHSVGMIILLGLILLITLHDITRIISGQSIIPR